LLYRSKFLDQIPRAVPISDSEESKLLRAAAGEVIIASFMSSDIFYPLFPWPKTGQTQLGISGDLLENVSYVDPEKEAILRAIISTIGGPAAEAAKDVIFDSLVEKVSGICEPLLRAIPENKKAFRSKLLNILNDAAQVWAKAQKSRARIVIVPVDDTKDIGEREKHQILKLAPDVHAELAVVLFPQIAYANTSDDSFIHQGWGIMTDLQLYQTGKLEWETQNRRFNIQNGPSGNRVR
jgi:hypothetical protein